MSDRLSQDLLQIVRKAVAVMLQQFREHGDGGHAREGVDLVEQNLPLFGQEEVDARQVGQLELTERLERVLVNGVSLRLSQSLGLERGLGVTGAAVLLFIGVELILGYADLPG